ncbi:MAG: ATP-binding protein [Marinobacter sp.]|nr:ATP-binding protein [Marinobacter sp.]
MVKQMNLFEVLARHEGVDTEYKSAKGGLPKTLWETYSAFANTAGGTLYLGIKETDFGPTTSGLSIAEADKLQRLFWETVNNPQKVSANILHEQDVTIETYQGDAILIIEVPRASRAERPVYTSVDPFKGTFRRNHEGDFRCNESEVQRMFADRLENEPADSRILIHFDLDDLDQDSLKQFRNRASSRVPDHPWLTEDTPGLLKKLGGWRKDRRTGEEGLTLAGLLMFGKTEAIQDNLAVPGFHLDYRERLAEDDETRWSDRLHVDGTWEANLFQFYQRVSQKLSHDPSLKVPFQPDRRNQSDAHEALKEALVNALIHADHDGEGGIIIERFKDRYEFSNPGTLLLSQEQLMAGGVSECRNKALQKMFQLLGVGDKAGSGLDKIRRSWHAHLWQPPSLRERYRPDRVSLILPLISMMPEDVIEQLQQRFGSTFWHLSTDEAQTLVIAATEHYVTNQRLQEMLTLHRVDITQMLRGLAERGLLVPHGQKRGTYYTLPGTGAQQESIDLLTSEGHSLTSEDHSLTSEDHSLTSGIQDTVPSQFEEKFGKDTARQLWELAAPMRGRKPPKAAVREIITKLCASRYLSRSELAELTGRNPVGLGTNYLTPMVRNGQLKLRYPEQPHHTQQQYTSVEGITE